MNCRIESLERTVIPPLVLVGSGRRVSSALSSTVMVLAALVLTVLVSACGAPARKDAGDADVVKVSNLPDRHRAVLDAWQKGGAAWELEREEVRADPALARFVVDNLLVEMVQAFDRSRLARSGQQAGPFERAQAELVELSDHSTAMLAQCLALRDGVVAFLAGDTLQRIGGGSNAEVAKLLEEENPKTRRRAAELLGKLPPDPAGEPRIQEALGKRVERDAEWVVRGEAAGALGARGASQANKGYAAGVLVRALDDADEAVALAAARALGTLGEPRVIPRIVDALESSAAAGRPAVVQAIGKTLLQLSKESKQRDARAWRAWWRAHEAGFAQPAAPEAPSGR